MPAGNSHINSMNNNLNNYKVRHDENCNNILLLRGPAHAPKYVDEIRQLL